MEIKINQHNKDNSMVEMWTKMDGVDYIMGLVHEDMFLELVGYGGFDDGKGIILDVRRKE